MLNPVDLGAIAAQINSGKRTPGDFSSWCRIKIALIKDAENAQYKTGFNVNEHGGMRAHWNRASKKLLDVHTWDELVGTVRDLAKAKGPLLDSFLVGGPLFLLKSLYEVRSYLKYDVVMDRGRDRPGCYTPEKKNTNFRQVGDSLEKAF